MTQILIFGPSTTYGAWDLEGGWAQRLRKYLDKKVIDSNYEEYFLVYNLGIDGDTTNGLLERFEREAKPRIWPDEETIIIFSIGGDDTIIDNKTKKSRVSPKTFEENIKEIIKLAKKYTSKIIFVGSEPIEESKVNPIPWLSGFSYKSDRIKEYGQIAEKVFDKEGLLFINLLDRLEKVDFKKYLTDGVHPTTEGYKLIFEEIKNFLIEKGILD